MAKANRLSKWKKYKKLHPLFFDSPLNEEFDNILNKIGYKDQLENKISELDIAELAREYIFNIKNGVPIIHVICPVLDTHKFKLTYSHSLDILFDGSEVEIERNVIKTIALAVACDIPVYPNNTKVEEKLIYYYQKLVADGFTAPNENGEDVKLIPVNSKSSKEFEINNFSEIDITKSWYVSDLLLLRKNIQAELQKLNSVKKTLTSLKLVIEELQNLLHEPVRNENRLQKCLTTNPILFGLEYMSIIPKHKLGSEYEVDYALEQYSGIIDLVEIESSNLSLFTKNGNPSNMLVHAEQQLIDWIDWIEKNSPYARSNMPGLITPKGIVIIGRSNNMSEKNKASLVRRNKAFNGLITILTYDDLLNKAQTMMKILSSVS